MANYTALFYVVTSRYRTYGFSNFSSCNSFIGKV